MKQSSWTEGRLDDLNRKVDVGIDRLDDQRKELRSEMREGFLKVDERFDEIADEINALRSEMKEGFARVDQEFRPSGAR